MRWSKLKQLVENNFADAVKPHLSIHSTAYGACTCGHAWITFDKEIIANFCTRAYYNRYQYGDKTTDNGINAEQAKNYSSQFVEYGEMSRQDCYESCWSFVHDLSFDKAMKSDNPLIQSLMVVDKRLGKRRIDNIDSSKLHPLANKLLEIRKNAEAKQWIHK
jgi:hypothetical protein